MKSGFKDHSEKSSKIIDDKLDGKQRMLKSWECKTELGLFQFARN